MLTKVYYRLPQEINAEQMTVHNIYSVAKWVKGIIKGTELPKSKQCVDYYNKEKQYEVRIEIGDFVIKKENGQFEVMTESDFNKTYKVLGE